MIPVSGITGYSGYATGNSCKIKKITQKWRMPDPQKTIRVHEKDEVGG